MVGPVAQTRGMDELLVLVGSELVDDVGRCAVAAGYRTVVGAGVGDVVAWQRASAVVVDVEAADGLVDPEMVRGHAVFLVCEPDQPTDLWREAFALGVRDVIALPDDERRLVSALTGLRAPVRDGGRVLAVLGGHGGAGATTLAAAVGLAAANGPSARVGVQPGVKLEMINFFTKNWNENGTSSSFCAVCVRFKFTIAPATM